MKKATLIIALVLSGMAIFSQTTNVPKEVEYALQDKYPDGSVVQWQERGEGKYMAEVEMEGISAEVVFSESGEWLESTLNIQEEALPYDVSEYLEKYFDKDNGFSYSSVQRWENSKEETFFVIVAESTKAAHILWFDKNGKLFKKEEASYEDWNDEEFEGEE